MVSVDAVRNAARYSLRMNRRTTRFLSIGFALSFALASACGGGKVTGVAAQWADSLCSDTSSLLGTMQKGVDAVIKAQLAATVSDASSATGKPLKDVQAGIEKLDEVFSSSEIVGTPMESVRNRIGKQLKNVYPVYDAIDAFTSATTGATTSKALEKPLSDLSLSIGGAAQGVEDLRDAIVVFKLDKDKAVAEAFSSAPQCKKIKKAGN